MTIACAAYNLVRLRRVIPACPQAGGRFTRRGSRQTEAARPHNQPVLVSNQLTNSTTAPIRSKDTGFLSNLLDIPR